MKILVVCFSRSGSTRALSRALARRMGADFDEIRPTDSFAGPLGLLRAVLHAMRRAKPQLNLARNPSAFDLVVIASPVWAGRLASPMRTYLARYGRDIRSVAALSVSGRGGVFPAFCSEIEQLIGAPLKAKLGLSQRDAGGPDLKDAFEPFIRQALGSRLERTAAVRPDPSPVA